MSCILRPWKTRTNCLGPNAIVSCYFARATLTFVYFALFLLTSPTVIFKKVEFHVGSVLLERS